jgi:hypothetical protein
VQAIYRSDTSTGCRKWTHLSNGGLLSALRGLGGSLGAVLLRPPGAVGEVDYRLARRRVLRQVKAGHVTRNDVCDAHPELLRAARNVGERTTDICPICEDATLAHVTYAFGPRLPAQGKIVETLATLRRLEQGVVTVECYTVEACPACGWNHLFRSFTVGGDAER